MEACKFSLSDDFCVLNSQYAFGFPDGLYRDQGLLYHVYICCDRARQLLRQDEASILGKYARYSLGYQVQILEGWHQFGTFVSRLSVSTLMIWPCKHTIGALHVQLILIPVF